MLGIGYHELPEPGTELDESTLTYRALAPEAPGGAGAVGLGAALWQ
jgi:hypothetical protein